MNTYKVKTFVICLTAAVIGGYIGLQIGKKITFAMQPEEDFIEDPEYDEEEAEVESEYIKSDIQKSRAKRIPVDYAGIGRDKPSLEEASAHLLSKTSLQKEEVNGEDEEEESTAEDDAYVISFDDFVDPTNVNEKKQLTYYSGDDILSDSEGLIIQESAPLFNADLLEQFGTWSNDPDVVYIRDEKKDIDYEVCRLFENYSDAAAGIPQKPKKSKLKKAQRSEDEEN